jgi:hypothetical protein
LKTLKIVKLAVRKWVSGIVRAVLIVGLLFLATGCGAKWHLNRAIAKDPTILEQAVVKLDTMVITENKLVSDTLILNQYDTIEIVKEGVKIQLKRLYDTIQVDVECPADTIRIQKEVKVPQVIYQEKKFRKKHFILLLLLFVAYTLALIKYIK